MHGVWSRRGPQPKLPRVTGALAILDVDWVIVWTPNTKRRYVGAPSVTADERATSVSRVDLAQLTLAATQNIQTANKVRRDPPVVKAAKQFLADSTKAVHSGGVLVREARSSWRRHSPSARGTGTDE